ncbi:MAG TPA: DUF4139 domain-containing protein [Myxococcales bacterium]|jgi:hypothetical protein
MPEKLVCTSRIARVVVYARGAMITRRVTLGAPAPQEAVDLVVPGISPLAEPGAFRADTLGGRLVLGLRPRLVFPERSSGGGEIREKIKELEREAQKLQARHAELTARREGLLALDAHPALNGRTRRADPAGRFGDALAVDALSAELTGALDADLQKLAGEIEASDRSLAAARLEAAQATSRAKAIPGHPAWEVTVHLAAGSPLTELELSYPVAAARWWPVYSARIAAGAASAELSLEAFVAHASFEDWTGVRIGLCTADMAADTRLPELDSLRLGRAQPPKKSGFRPPPEGLEVLFAGYDLAMRGLPPTGAGAVIGGSFQNEAITPPQGNLMPPSEDKPMLEQAKDEAYDDLDELSAAPMEAEEEAAPEREMFKKADFKMRSGAPPPMQAAPSAAAMSTARPMAPGAAPSPKGGAMRARNAPLAGRRQEMGEGGGGSFGGMALPEPEPEEIDADAWLDFDALALPANESSRRGHLTKASSGDRRSLLAEANVRVEAASPPGGPLDPLRARGEFDHRFDAQGPVDVPSNGLPHRITLAAAGAPVKARFRAVPREGAEVYREAVLTNPFPSPLLGGPVDVFMDGALLSTTPVSPVGRGGVLTLGLGVEERLRVARNARAAEAAKGVFSGTSAIEHHVDVDVTSALGLDVELEVLERLPVTDDKDVKITALEAKPAGEAYDQADRGLPIRGGVRFRLHVPAGGKAALSYGYLVELPSKMEIVGGNRRE